jgi:hypothetical protein
MNAGVVDTYKGRASRNKDQQVPGYATLGSRTDTLNEIAEILAAGLMRLQARKSSVKSADFGDSSLHFSPDRSGHPEGFPSENGQ